MKLLFILLSLLLIVISCQTIVYEDDNGFLNSAQANSMEFLVRLNGSACMDMDKKVGLCAKRISSTTTLKFTQDARPYGYRIYIKCSKALGVDESFDIASNSKFTYEIAPAKFQGVKAFSCVGEIFPDDRDQEISAMWTAKILVFDAAYTARETIYLKTKKKKEYLVMGANARYVFYRGKWKKKKTILKVVKGDHFAYSESVKMRFNYYGIK